MATTELYNDPHKIRLIEQANHQLSQENNILKKQNIRTQTAYKEVQAQLQATQVQLHVVQAQLESQQRENQVVQHSNQRLQNRIVVLEEKDAQRNEQIALLMVQENLPVTQQPVLLVPHHDLAPALLSPFRPIASDMPGLPIAVQESNQELQSPEPRTDIDELASPLRSPAPAVVNNAEVTEKIKLRLSNSKKYIASSQWNGKYYATHSDWQFRIADLALSHLQIPAHAKILDIGCGDGRFTKHLANLVPSCEILGLDPSVSMLSTAQNNIAPNLSFNLGDAMNLPFENKFDRIVAFNSLHWVSEINVALKQVYKALSPGGQVLILVAPVQVRHPIHKIIDEVARRDRWHAYFDCGSSIFHFFSCAEWASLIEEAGMIPEKLQFIDASLEYKNIKEFSDSIKSWIPFGTIPEEKKDAYICDIVEAYIQNTPCSSKGIVYYHIDELIILASKQNLTGHKEE